MALPRFPDHMEIPSLPSWVFFYTGSSSTQSYKRSNSHTHLDKHIYILHQSSYPLYVAVGADKQCELTCRPAGYRFYVRLAERVRDGTPCINVTSNDVCVEGKCLVSAFKSVCVGASSD